ncbi:unnamed protein product [Linum tenue]|uniref:Uncharacterized protein n=1 Tax=Linum tenue TaxID=586396 RepID=A0AAV0Q6F3_9ROSI|nr:unnamed protein product [Linum tenue]
MATPAADSDGDIAQPEVASTPPPAAAPATDSPAAVAVPPTETSPVHDSATSSGGEAPLEPDAAATPPPAQPILRRGDRVRRPSTRLAGRTVLLLVELRAVDSVCNFGAQSAMQKMAHSWFSGTVSEDQQLPQQQNTSSSLLADWNSYASSRNANDEGSGMSLGFDLESAVRSANETVSGTFNV